MKRIKTFILAFALLFVANVGISQFVTGEFNEVAEYCHVDIVGPDHILHRDYTEEITITKDSMIIKLDNNDNLTFLLGDFMYLPNVPARVIRRMVNVEHPEDQLLGMYVADELVSIRNVNTGVIVSFYLKNICDKMVKKGDGKWLTEQTKKDKQTD